MMKTKIKMQRDMKTPVSGLVFALLCTVSFVFLCMILITVLRFLAGGIFG